MAGSKADAFEGIVLDLVFKAATWTTQTGGPYVALYTGTLTGDTPGTEVAAGGYARVQVPAANWTRTGDTVTNNATITFGTPTANWGTVTHVGVHSAATAGTTYYLMDLGTARTINNGDSAPSFAASTLTVSEG